MSYVKYKTTKHRKKQENATHNKEKNQTIQAGPEMTQMTKLVHQNCYYNCIPYVQKSR